MNTLLKKASFFLPVAGAILFLIVLIFTLYAFNHPEGGFAFEISAETVSTIYFSCVGITYLILVAGSVLLFTKGFDNTIQKSGAAIFLIGVIFLLLFLVFYFIPMFTASLDPLISLLSLGPYWEDLSLFWLFGSPILFVAGIILSRYKK